jgi:hypothetical protein
MRLQYRIGIVMAGIIAAAFMAPLPDAPSIAAAPKPDIVHGFSACDMAHKFVKDRLKAPATAEFPACFTLTGGGTKFASPRKGGIDTVFTVVSHVDAQNGFGAKLRNNFVAEVRYTGDERWQLVNLTFDH